MKTVLIVVIVMTAGLALGWVTEWWNDRRAEKRAGQQTRERKWTT
jgi:hypothetical protein